MSYKGQRYNIFIFDKNRKKFKVDEMQDWYRDFCHRNNISYDDLAIILGISKTSLTNKMFKSSCKLRDIVNIMYFSTKKGLKVPGLKEATTIMPTDKDKERIDKLLLMLERDG